MIEAEDLSRDFHPAGAMPIRALDGVTFKVPRGAVTGLLGPNGAGKTTLLRVLSGVLRPGGGRARIAGHDLALEPAQARARVGLLTEEPGLPDRLSPLWHLALHGSLRRLPREEAVRRARRLLREMGLEASQASPCARLSAGHRRKVALARALICEPPALLLDEPTAHLDIESAAWARQAIRARARAGAAVLIATHNLEEAERLCGEVILLGGGRVRANLRADDLRGTPVGRTFLVVRLRAASHAVLAAARRALPSAVATVYEDRLVVACASADEAARLVSAIGAAVGAGAIAAFHYGADPLGRTGRRLEDEAP